MKRHEIEHIIRASGNITNEDKFVIIGSQAILGSIEAPPAELTVSQEADIYPLNNPHKADMIDGCIGEMSPFHDEFGYYAHGVGPKTALLPKNWQKRLKTLENENTRGVTAYCISVPDLCISKILAGRARDIEFVSAMISKKLVSKKQIKDLLPELKPEYKEKILLFFRKFQ